MSDSRKRTHAREHIERCIEMYGAPIDADFNEQIDRNSFEQMRADMMMLVGIAAAMQDLIDD